MMTLNSNPFELATVVKYDYCSGAQMDVIYLRISSKITLDLSLSSYHSYEPVPLCV